ncbi:MAG TPA: hypothetical protein ENJ97_02370 [Planctomycetes bacterium]|nr:hypothetical protein [Planctomycetota bacterium]
MARSFFPWMAAFSLVALLLPACSSTSPGGVRGGGTFFRVPSDLVWEKDVFVGQKGRAITHCWVAGKWVLLETADHFLIGLGLEKGNAYFEVEAREALAFPPSADGDRVAFVTSGRLVLLEGPTGRVLVDHRLQFLPAGSPAIVKDSLYLATLDGNRVVAFSARTGREGWSWRSKLGSPLFGPVACHVQGGGGGLAEALDSGGVVGLPALSAEVAGPREPLWTARQLGPGGGGLEVSGDTVYLASSDTRVYALAGGTGMVLWTFPAGAACLGRPSFSAGKLFVRTRRGTFCLDPQGGRKLWKLSGDLAFLACANKAAYLVSRGGMLVKVEPSTGEILENYPTPGVFWARNVTDPTLVGATRHGHVMAFRP